MNQQDIKHVWEINGLGKAPFKCVGVFSLPSKALLEANPAAYNQEMACAPRGFYLGTCGVCGTSLTNNFLIRSACGNSFSVGCDCVQKSGDIGLVCEVDFIQRKAAKEMRRQKREEERVRLLQEQRSRNGGLTDYEMQEQELLRIQQQQAIQAQQKGEIIKEVLEPIVAALKAAPGNFVCDMIEEISRGELPSKRALDIVCRIYGKHHAHQETKKTRGSAYDESKLKGVELAYELFQRAEALLQNTPSM